MKKTTVKEYDSEGKLIKETIIEEDESPVYVPYPVYPSYPAYPILPPVTYKYDVICGSPQKG